jgi:hypothetical protein
MYTWYSSSAQLHQMVQAAAAGMWKLYYQVLYQLSVVLFLLPHISTGTVVTQQSPQCCHQSHQTARLLCFRSNTQQEYLEYQEYQEYLEYLEYLEYFKNKTRCNNYNCTCIPGILVLLDIILWYSRVTIDDKTLV